MLLVEMNIRECVDGYIIAKDIFNSSGTLLLSKNTTINAYVRDKLLSNNIEVIWIYGQYVDTNKNITQQKYQMIINKIKDMINLLAVGESLDYDKFEIVCNELLGLSIDTVHIQDYLYRINRMDEYTYSHSINVGFYAMLLAKWLNLSNEKVLMCLKAGILHDIGKIKVSNEIINKSSRLTDEEMIEVKMHSYYGYNIIKEEENVHQVIKESVLLHHERNDGSGYPYGISKDQISDITQIVSIADVFDAMTSDRVYKEGKTPFAAFEELGNLCTDTLNFDMLKVFIERLAPYYTGAKVQLNTGEIGEVVYLPPHCISKPVVNVQEDYIDLSQNYEIKIERIIG